tara:strand:+ start:177 stop:443 length:267 start_codon:yes stop_codon:yes gene_type:complete
MPYHNDKDIYKSKEDISKEKKERKPSKMSFFESVKISKEDMKKLKEHSKLHKGGMDSKHMKNMKKIMKQGKTFSQAHKEANILDKKRK